MGLPVVGSENGTVHAMRAIHLVKMSWLVQEQISINCLVKTPSLGCSGVSSMDTCKVSPLLVDAMPLKRSALSRILVSFPTMFQY